MPFSVRPSLRPQGARAVAGGAARPCEQTPGERPANAPPFAFPARSANDSHVGTPRRSPAPLGWLPLFRRTSLTSAMRARTRIYLSLTLGALTTVAVAWTCAMQPATTVSNYVTLNINEHGAWPRRMLNIQDDRRTGRRLYQIRTLY